MIKYFFYLAIFLPFSVSAQKYVEISGVVTNSDSKGILEATVEVVGLLQTTRTDANGNFSLTLKDPAQKITLKIFKEGYERYEIEHVLPIKSVLAIRLKQISRPTVSITQLDFGSQITGRIEGITPEMEGQYKILVFVFTNTYYIHSYPDSEYPVNSNGEWKMESIWHPNSPCPTRVVAILVDKNYEPKSPTAVPDKNAISSDKAGKEKIKCN